MTWMKWRRLLQGIVASLVVLVLLVALGGPWLLYGIGLANIKGRPELAKRSATVAEMQAVWARHHGVGEPVVDVLSPYEYILEIVRNTPAKHQPGQSIAWFVAARYNADHLVNHQTLRWHLSGACLIIWLTRHWSTGQILSKAVELGDARSRG